MIEVRSRSDPRSTVEEKMELWLENGAELACLIDPIAGSVVIYAAGEEPEVLERPEIVVGSGPVTGFALRAMRLWEGPR